MEPLSFKIGQCLTKKMFVDKNFFGRREYDIGI